MSRRQQQVEANLQRVLSRVLTQQLADPRVCGMVSVTRVSVSPDMRTAQVFVSVLPEQFQKRTLYGLRHAAGHIHAKLRAAIRMRVVPHLEFRLDDSLKKQAQTLEAIRRANEPTGSDQGPQEPQP